LADRDVRTVRDPKVDVRVDLPAAQDPTGVGRLVHQWAHATKAGITPVATEMVAMIAAGSMAHDRGAVTSAIVTPAGAALKEKTLKATDMPVPLVDTECDANANASPARPSAIVTMAPGLRAHRVRHSIGV